MSALKFEDQKFPEKSGINDYVRLAEQFIPGRRAIFAITEAALLELLPKGQSRLLVVGAGGGEEIVRLGQNNEDWSFVGVDTFQPMVDLARQRLAETPVGKRSQVHAVAIDSLDDRDFDAATCILTAHFCARRRRKTLILRIHSIAPEARCAVGHRRRRRRGRRGADRLLRRIWKRHAILNGVAEEAAAANAETFKKVAVVSADREEQLLTAAGFSRLTPIFRGLTIKGWLAFA